MWLRTKGYRPFKRSVVQPLDAPLSRCRCVELDSMLLQRRYQYNALVKVTAPAVTNSKSIFSTISIFTNANGHDRSRSRQSFSPFSSFSATTATIVTTPDWTDMIDDDDEDEISFMRRRKQQPNLTLTKKGKESIYVSMEEEREIRALNKKHRHLRILRPDEDYDSNDTAKNQKTYTFEQLEMQKLQFQQLQTKHYMAAQNLIQMGNEILTTGVVHLTHNSKNSKNKSQNYSKLLHSITSFTHSYFMLVNHHRVYQQKYSYNRTPHFWYLPEYRTTTFEAVNMALDVLQYIVQQKIEQEKPNVVVEMKAIPKQSYNNINKEEMKEAELLKYELDIHEGYINDIKNNQTSDSKINTSTSLHDAVKEVDYETDDDDANMISNNDTMWIYYPGIIYNPLIQIWNHMSLHHHNNNINRPQDRTPPVSFSKHTPNLDGRIIAPEVAATLAITNAITINDGNRYQSNNDCNLVSNKDNELRTAQQVLEQFQQLILSSIEYTQYSNPLLLRQDLPHQSKNPKKVPYKLFYNSATFNMILEVLMHQHQCKDATPPTTTKKKPNRKKEKSDTNLEMCPKKSELTAAVMQNSFLAVNDAIRKCIQQFHPKIDSNDGKIGILEDVVNNYGKYLEDLNERYWTFPTTPKRPVWQDEIEDNRIAMEDIASQEAELAGHYVDDENAIVPESEEAVPIRYTSVNPTTYPPRDSIALGMLFRPDIHTYNLFMKTWALKCHDIKEAAIQVHRIYRDMQQEGFELAPDVETYNVMLYFYSTQPDKFVHVVERLIQYLIDKQGIRNVQLLHWYYAIEIYTTILKHKLKAKEYLENMIYSSHHHKFLSDKTDGDDPYAQVTIIAEDDSDLQSIAIIQRAAQLVMNMYRKEVQHHLEVIQHTNKYVKDGKQTSAAIAKSTKEIDIALRNSFDLYIKLKETGFLEFSGEQRDDGYLKYRDEIRSTFMDIYAYAGQTENAMKIFHRIVRTNVSNYLTLIDAHAKHDNIDGAEAIYDLMIDDRNITQLNCDVFTTLMNGYANSTKYPANELADSIIGVFHRMQNEPKCTNHNIRPDTETFNSLLKSLCDISIDESMKKSDVRFIRAVSILDAMELCTGSDGTQNGESLVKPTISTYLKIVQTGLKVEDFDGVFKIVERMAMTPISDTIPTKRYLNSDSNHTIFHMYREVNTFESLDRMIKLLNCLNQWADEKLTLLRPTAGTYSVLYKACIDLRQKKRSKSSECKIRRIVEQLYEQMKGVNINPNHSTYTELIDYYALSKKRKDLEYASDLLIELEEKNDPSMRSDERQYNALFYGYLSNIGDTAAAAQILFRYTKGYLAKKIKYRPSGRLYQTILKTYLESDELVKAALFIDQIHILQQQEPVIDEIKGVTIQLDHEGVPHHIGPDVVTMGHLIKAIKESTWMEPSDKDFYKRLVSKHSDAIKRFHRKRIRIKRKAFLYL